MVFCSYDKLNIAYDESGNELHACKYYGTYLCDKCGACYDGDKIKRYMEDNPKEH